MRILRPGWFLLLSAIGGCSIQPPPADTDPIVANPNGTVSTVVGTGTAGDGGDGGLAREAVLDQPMDLAIAADGALLIADFGNHRVLRVEVSTGLISTLAGTGDATGDRALNSPAGITPRSDGGFVVLAWGEHRVYEYAADGSRSILAGTGQGECALSPADLTAPLTSLVLPRSADIMADGSLLVSEQGCQRIRRIADNVTTTYAGSGEAGYGGDGGPAGVATLFAGASDDGPSLGISLSPEDPPDELFIADTENHVIRQVKVFTLRMETFAGSGQRGFRDGPPDEAQFDRPTHVFADRDHSLWIVDSGNHAIRYVDPLGTRVTTVVGTGTAGFNGDGLAPGATQLNHPTSVTLDVQGWVFIADSGNHRIRLYASR